MCHATLKTLVLCLSVTSVWVAGTAQQPQKEGGDKNTLTVAAPTFTFQGTVEKTHSTTIPGMSPEDNTSVVRVDEIIDAPASLAGSKRKAITILLQNAGDLPEGSHATFYTVGWILGKEIAVKEIRHSGENKNEAQQTLGAVRTAAARETLARQVNLSPFIITGQVLDIKPVEKQLKRSEHDTDWMIAMVKVASVEKNSSANSLHPAQVVAILFPHPSNRDIEWINSPRFTVGQKGVWLLHKAAGRFLAAGPAPNTFTAAESGDFKSLDQLQNIRSAMK
jgi:hypothetical protein